MSTQVISSLRRLFKRVKSISRVCRWAFAISINFRLARFLVCAQWLRFSVWKTATKVRDRFPEETRKGENSCAEHASSPVERKYTRETIRLACHAAHRSRVSRGKKDKRCYACTCMRNKERWTEAEERNSRQTRPRNTAHSAHFPALSYYSLSEPSRAEYESVRSRAKLHLGWS